MVLRPVHSLLAADERCTARLQEVADTLATFVRAVQRQRAQGKSTDLRLVRVTYHNAGAALHTALQRAAPIEPELFTAILSLQEQREAVRELLP